jgi:hypothetical protein
VQRRSGPEFVVPGSFLPANIPAGGVPGAARRDGRRQARAPAGTGSFTSRRRRCGGSRGRRLRTRGCRRCRPAPSPLPH